MEAKDTVISDLEMKEAVLDRCNVEIEVTERDRAIAEAQAVITWMRGYHKGLERGKKVGKKVGIREVFAWAEQDCDCGMNVIGTHWQCGLCRQNKLKEWGIA